MIIIQAQSTQNPKTSDALQTNLADQMTSSNDSNSNYEEIEAILRDSMTQYEKANKFDALVNGSITVNDLDYPTDSLNTDYLYNLLVKLNANDQLEMNDSSLTSQFYLTPNELSSLLEPNENNASIKTTHSEETTGALLGDALNCIDFNENAVANLNPNQFALNSLTPNVNLAQTEQSVERFQCQEICCLLKINALDFNYELI